MELLIAFMFGVLGLSIWELHSGPRWRPVLVIAVCAAIAVGYMSQRVV